MNLLVKRNLTERVDCAIEVEIQARRRKREDEGDIYKDFSCRRSDFTASLDCHEAVHGDSGAVTFNCWLSGRVGYRDICQTVNGEDGERSNLCMIVTCQPYSARAYK